MLPCTIRLGGYRPKGKTPGSAVESLSWAESPKGETNKERQYKVSGAE